MKKEGKTGRQLLFFLVIFSRYFSSKAQQERLLAPITPPSSSPLLDPKLRVAVFGGTAACGGGLADKSAAYPHLLFNDEHDSENGKNSHDYAHSSMGPNHYATCLDSIITNGEGGGGEVEHTIYDIIILDYWLRFREGLDLLAHRLRLKYPNAMIIFLKTNAAAPRFFRRRDDDSTSRKQQSFVDWRREHSDDWRTALENDVDGDWFLPQHKEAHDAIQRMSEEVNGSVYDFPPHDYNSTDERNLLLTYLDWYDEVRHFHLNEIGQNRLATFLKNHIQQQIDNNGSVDEFIQQSNDLTDTDKHNRDFCDWWFYHGPNSTIMNRGNRLFKEVDAHNHHWVMEFNDNYETVDMGSFFVANRGESKFLYLSYMRTKLASDDEEASYPDIVVGGIYRNASPVSFEIKLNTTDTHHDHEAFEIMTTLIATDILPSVYPITLKPIYSKETKKVPFRLVGYIFSDTPPMEYAFGPLHAIAANK